MAIFKSATDKSGRPIKYDTAAKMWLVLHYINSLEKTTEELRGGVYLYDSDKAYDEFMFLKRMYGKEDGRMCLHFIQSFAPGETTPEVAKQIADEMVRHPLFQGWQISYAVHLDKSHIHTHFIINSVNAEDGHKWQLTNSGLQELKDYSDELCKKHGLSIIHTEKHKKQWKSQAQIEAEEKGTSWKKETQLAVDEALKIAINRADFISIMNMQGYKVRWNADQKYLLFTNMDEKSMRNLKFDHPENYTKAAMYLQFAKNREEQNIKDDKNSDYNDIRKTTYLDVKDALHIATSKADFISILNSQGYTVQWDDKHKYITFQQKGHRPVRNRNFFPPEKFTKEAMEERFEKNREKAEKIENGEYDRDRLSEGEQKRFDVLYLISTFFRGGKKACPHQNYAREQSAQAIRDYLAEKEKGNGMDWEH